MTLLRTLLIGITLTLTGLAQADTLSVSFGGGVWKESPSGSLRNVTTGDLIGADVESNLFWKEENQGYYFITLEHPVPLIPNLRIMSTNLDHNGSGSSSFTLNGKTYSADITNELTLDQTDVTVYWEILDNVVSLDLGLNVKLVDISYSITDVNDSTNNTNDQFDGALPMLYGLVGVSPYPGLIFSAEGSYVGYSGNRITDFTAKVAYTTDYFFGIEAGYRALKLKLDDVSDYSSDLTFDGPFAGLYLKF